MKIRKQSEDWYIGEADGLKFFGFSRRQVLRKIYAHYLSKHVDCQRLADKLIALDESYREARA